MKITVFSNVTLNIFIVFSSNEFLAAVAAKITVSWDVAPYILVDTFSRLRGNCCLRHDDKCKYPSVVMQEVNPREE
jgi:hypothetical protein